jgi:hypothetical protein
VSAQTTASPVLWGGAAAGLIGAAMVVAMEAQRKRKEEEARQIAEMNRINADSRAREKGYQSHADMVEKQRQSAWDAAFLEALAAEQQRKIEKSVAINDEFDDGEEAWMKKKADYSIPINSSDLVTAKPQPKVDHPVAMAIEAAASKPVPKLALPAMQRLFQAGNSIIQSLMPKAVVKNNQLDTSKGEAGLEVSGAKSAAVSPSSKYSGSITNPQRPPDISAAKWARLPLEDKLDIAAEHEARMQRVNPPWLLENGRPVSIDREDWKYYDAEDRRKAVADVRKMWNTWLDNGYEGDFEIYARGGLLYWANGYLNIRKEPANNSRRIIQLYPNSKVIWTGISIQVLVKGEIEHWYEVKYIPVKGKDKGKEFIGWVPWRSIRTSQPWRASLYEPKLTTHHSNKYGGEDVKELYDLMAGQKDAWWYDDGDFTLEEFVGLIAIHEANIGFPVKLNGEFEPDSMLRGYLTTKAFAQQLYVGGWANPYCPSGVCTNGPLNMLAAYSQSVHSLIDRFIGSQDKNPIINYDGLKKMLNENAPFMDGPNREARIKQYMDLAREFGNRIMHPESLIFDRYNGLSNFGAEEITFDRVEALLKLNKDHVIDIDPDTFYPEGKYGIYYYSKNGHLLYSSVNGELLLESLQSQLDN